MITICQDKCFASSANFLDPRKATLVVQQVTFPLNHTIIQPIFSILIHKNIMAEIVKGLAEDPVYQQVQLCELSVQEPVKKRKSDCPCPGLFSEISASFISLHIYSWMQVQFAELTLSHCNGQVLILSALY